MVYRSCVLSSLLYGSETWTPYARQERRMNSFHLRCLKRILGICWQQKVPHVEVLRRAGLCSIQATLAERRLKWLGHVHRMADSRLPKQVLYGELVQGKRKRGGQMKRFKAQVKLDLEVFGISPASWTQLAEDRSKWRTSVKKGVKLLEAAHAERKRATKSKAKTNPPPEGKRRAPEPAAQPESQSWPCSNCNRVCKSRIGLVSHMRKCCKTA